MVTKYHFSRKKLITNRKFVKTCDEHYVLKSLAFLGRCTSVGRRHWDVEVYVVIIASVLEQFVIV